MRIILASTSPRRLFLLKKLCGDFEVIAPNVDEDAFFAQNPADLAVALSRAKAAEVFQREKGMVIAADTVVEIDGTVLGKPENAEKAREMFRLLCGRTHRVITGFSVLSDTGEDFGFDESFVTFGDYDDSVIEAYIASGKPFDKAGGYGVQDSELSCLVKGVTGSLDNIIGLPTEKLADILRIRADILKKEEM